MIFNKKPKTDPKVLTANQFVNIRRIANDLLYTEDEYIFSYLKVSSINTELMSERESEILVNNITAQLSTENKPIQFFILTQPDDVSEMMNMLHSLFKEAKGNIIKEQLIFKEINQISNYALKGEISTRQFYMVLWTKYTEDNELVLKKRASNLINKLSSCGLPTKLLTNQGIYKLMNLFSHPTSKYASVETTDYSPTIPRLIWGDDNEKTKS